MAVVRAPIQLLLLMDLEDGLSHQIEKIWPKRDLKKILQRLKIKRVTMRAATPIPIWVVSSTHPKTTLQKAIPISKWILILNSTSHWKLKRNWLLLRLVHKRKFSIWKSYKEELNKLMKERADSSKSLYQRKTSQMTSKRSKVAQILLTSYPKIASKTLSSINSRPSFSLPFLAQSIQLRSKMQVSARKLLSLCLLWSKIEVQSATIPQIFKFEFFTLSKQTAQNVNINQKVVISNMYQLSYKLPKPDSTPSNPSHHMIGTIKNSYILPKNTE